MKRAFLLLMLPICTVSVYAHGLWRDKITASDPAAQALFGSSVSISHNLCVVGTPWDDDNADFSGSAYIFRFDGNVWIQEQKLLASDGSPQDEFGSSVSIDGNACIVGALGDDDMGTDSGAVYVFRYSEPNWLQEAKLTASDGRSWDAFGASVSTSDNVCVIGAPGYDDNGRAYIFRFNGSQWLQEAKINSPTSTAGDEFGCSVSISSDVCIIGDPNDASTAANSGAAYIFRFDDPNWVLEARLTSPDGSAGDFGLSVAVDGGICIVGACGDDDNGQDSGSAYIFRFNDPNWILRQVLLPSDGEPNDLFGSSVSISGNLCVVGAPQDDEKGCESGSAYLFRLDVSNWVQADKLVAFDGSELDRFGGCVSIDSDYVVVGAAGKNDGTGAAYTFIPCPQADLSGDCFVGLEDLFIFVRQWLTGANPL
jgi:hypothetical protein